MGWVTPVAMGLGSLLGGLFGGGHKQKQKTSFSNTSTSTPFFDPSMGSMRDLLVRRTMGGLGQRSFLGQGLGNQRIADANQVFEGLRRGQEGRLGAAGLLGSPVAESGALSLDMARGGEITKGLSDIPLIEEEMDQNRLRSAQGLLALGRGTTTTSSGTGTGEMQQGNAFGAGLTDLMSMLGWMYGNGMLGGEGGGGEQASTGALPWGFGQRRMG